MSRVRIFVDGATGTVGLGIRERLSMTTWAEAVELPEALRKDPSAKRKLLGEVHAVVLCLPDAAAREVVSMVDAMGASGPRVLDASTAHRVANDWVYGFPELTPEQPAAIRRARRVANPGCYPTGAVALLRPLVDANLVPREQAVTVNAVSGYSGGGRALIEAFESGRAPAFKLYGLGLAHKHLPEMGHYAGLEGSPLFVPSVGHFRQGMLVSVPLQLSRLPRAPTPEALHLALQRRYEGTAVEVSQVDPPIELDPEALNGTDRLELFVFGNAARSQALLVARLDNLGKGAAGAAVQNLELMLRPDSN